MVAKYQLLMVKVPNIYMEESILNAFTKHPG